MKPSVPIVLPGEPVAKERPRVNTKTKTVYTPKATKDYENFVAVAAKAAGMKFGPDRVIVNMEFYPSIDKGKDLDNLIKSVLDGLTKGKAWDDDRQVVELHATKKLIEKHPYARVTVRSF